MSQDQNTMEQFVQNDFVGPTSSPGVVVPVYFAEVKEGTTLINGEWPVTLKNGLLADCAL